MIAAFLIVTIVALTIIVWTILSRAVFEITLDGNKYGVTTSYGLDPMNPSMSMDFKMKPPKGEELIGLFCIGLRKYRRRNTAPPSKKYYITMNRSALGFTVLKQEPKEEILFQHKLDVDYFDDQWHNISISIDIPAQKITVTFDDGEPITIDDKSSGHYPLGTANMAYIGGALGCYVGVGIVKNVKFGNIFKSFKT